jgi:hypothetical protein
MPRPLRVVLVLLPLLVGLAVGGWYVYQQSRENHTGPGDPNRLQAGKPAGKLVVLVVFDQMRGDYLARWAEQFGPDGFERMKKGGIWYADCHLPYACSSTGPGHASMVTGAPPSVHGIVENDWYDRKAAARVYCVEPLRPYDRVPPLRVKGGEPARGAESGFSPERLLVPTVGDALKSATGGRGRVVSLSIKDRGAVLMGGTKPDAAYCFDTRDGAFHTGAYYRERPHRWVEEFNASGVVNKWFGARWERFRPDLDYTALAGPDDAPGEAFGTAQGRLFPHPTTGGEPAAGPKYYAALETSPFGNQLLLELVKKAVTGEKLGSGDAADLLCVSFSSNDLVGHQWGPDSWEVLDVSLRSDALIAEFLRFLDQTLGPDRYVLLVTSDHGICPIPEQRKLLAARRVTPQEVLAPLAAALDETFGKQPGGESRWFEAMDRPDRVWPWVYLNQALLSARGIPYEVACDYAAQWLGNRPYLEAAFTRRQIETGFFPPGTLGDRVKQAYHPDRCGDVIAVPKPGVLVTGYGSGTSHGSPHSYDTHVPVLVYGAGVPAEGKHSGRVSSLIVAPILAWALGIDPPPAATLRVPTEFTPAQRR